MKQLIYTLLIVLLMMTRAISQDVKLTDPIKKTTIDSVAKYLKARYVFPDAADQMAANLSKRMKGGEYKKITDPVEFANKLTDDLRSVSHDRHLRVTYDPKAIADEKNAISDEEKAQLEKKFVENMRRNNFAFKELRVLEGNVGYLDLRGFNPTQYASETAVAAMNFLANADAVIIDLRFNGGGSPAMVQLICSYFFSSDLVHLNSLYFRPTNTTQQFWTLPHVEGKRMPDVDLYVLTSNRTFSGAEEFAYNLQNLKRATIVGETTGGGAHPGGTVNVTDSYRVWIPTGRAINPISKTNWEGTGVKPDVEVPATSALDKAHTLAFEALIKRTDDAEMKRNLQWQKETLMANLEPVEVSEEKMRKFAGSYGPRKIRLEDDKLFYQRDNGPLFEMTAINETTFMLKEAPQLRIEFLEENGSVVAINGRFMDGRVEKNVRVSN